MKNDVQSIKTSEDGWQKKLAKVMKEKEPFRLITVDKEWNPTSDNPLDIAKLIWGTALPGWVASLLVEKNIGLGATAFNAAASPSPSKDIPLDDGNKLPIAGAGILMLLGAGMILLAFFDPEPTTKLGLLVGGGIATILGGGMILLTIILTRKNYEWEMHVDPKTRKVVWKGKPKN